MVTIGQQSMFGNQQVSDLVDGELAQETAEDVVARLLREPALRERWLTYHRQADAMRFPTPSALDDVGFIQRFSARLAHEPVHLSVAPVSTKTSASWRRVWVRYGLPGLAMAAAVASVTWMTLPEFSGRTGGEFHAPVVALGTTGRPVGEQDFGQMQQYLIAHQQFAPSSQLHGVAPYVRTAVGDGTRSRTEGAVPKQVRP